MLEQDKKIINDVRLLSLKAGLVYEDLAKQTPDQRSRNILKRLATHRKEIVNAITSQDSAVKQSDILSESVPQSIRAESEQSDIDSNLNWEPERITTLIVKERREITYLRNEVKRIENYSLRCRLSSFVATLQMDFDQLRSLASVKKGD